MLSVDEKPRIQALNRAQPGLAMNKGHCGTINRGCKGNGTTTLFAPLDMREGKIIDRCMKRHRRRKLIHFFTVVEREDPAGKVGHDIVDNRPRTSSPKSALGLATIHDSILIS